MNWRNRQILAMILLAFLISMGAYQIRHGILYAAYPILLACAVLIVMDDSWP